MRPFRVYSLDAGERAQRRRTDADGARSGHAVDPDEPGDVARFSLRRRGPVTHLTEVNADVLGNKRIGELKEVW
jgi:hypothetical protein